MLKLSQLFFRSTALTFSIVFIFAAAAGYILLREMEIDIHKTMLRNMIVITEPDLLVSRHEQIPRVIREAHRKTDARFTVIAPNGKVLYESDRSPEGMENHADRPEIKEAEAKEWGSSIRYSATLKEELLYVAHHTPDFTLRIAYSLASIREQLLILWLKAVLFFAIVLGIVFWLSVRLNRRIDRDTHLIKHSLEQILEKKYEDDSAHVECCREFSEIRKLIGKVARRLAKRQRQKEKYTRKLKELTQRQSDIISAISHEFKNPVAAIMGYTQSLEEIRDLDPRLRSRFIEKIYRNAEKISQMIDRLSLAIKLESSSFAPRYSSFELKPIAENVRELLLQKYNGRSIHLECREVKLHADRDMIEHLLINLTENALKYSEDEVTIRCLDERVEIVDYGEGIDRDELEKITLKFYRINRLSWNNSIGVGLYIVKYILKLHKTELEIESEAQSGSTFSFSLKNMKA